MKRTVFGLEYVDVMLTIESGLKHAIQVKASVEVMPKILQSDIARTALLYLCLGRLQVLLRSNTIQKGDRPTKIQRFLKNYCDIRPTDKQRSAVVTAKLMLFLQTKRNEVFYYANPALIALQFQHAQDHGFTLDAVTSLHVFYPPVYFDPPTEKIVHVGDPESKETETLVRFFPTDLSPNQLSDLGEGRETGNDIMLLFAPLIGVCVPGLQVMEYQDALEGRTHHMVTSKRDPSYDYSLFLWLDRGPRIRTNVKVVQPYVDLTRNEEEEEEEEEEGVQVQEEQGSPPSITAKAKPIEHYEAFLVLPDNNCVHIDGLQQKFNMNKPFHREVWEDFLKDTGTNLPHSLRFPDQHGLMCNQIALAYVCAILVRGLRNLATVRQFLEPNEKGVANMEPNSKLSPLLVRMLLTLIPQDFIPRAT